MEYNVTGEYKSVKNAVPFRLCGVKQPKQTSPDAFVSAGQMFKIILSIAM